MAQVEIIHNGKQGPVNTGFPYPDGVYSPVLSAHSKATLLSLPLEYTLQPYSEYHRCTLGCHSVNLIKSLTSIHTLHISDALQCHFGGTLHCHSKATLKVHSDATPACTLHCHSIITTPMPPPHYTPMPLRSIFGMLICIFATQSNATPMPPVYGNSALHQHPKDTLLPLHWGKG